MQKSVVSVYIGIYVQHITFISSHLPVESLGHSATQCFRVMCISFYAMCLVRSIFGCYPGIFSMVSAVGLAQQAETS